MEKKKLIVIGHGMVGHSFIEKFYQSGGCETHSLQVFGEEPHLAYDRVHLSAFFEKKSPESLQIADRAEYAKFGVTLHTGKKINAIDREQRTVQDTEGNVYGFDTLVLSTGSIPFVPPIPESEKKGVFVYRTIEDVQNILAYAKDCSSCAVIGGGLLGLEAAKASLDLGLKTHVVEFAPRLMPRQLDEQGSLLLKEKIEGLGIQVHLKSETHEIRGKEKVQSLLLKNGEELPVEMVIISAGIKPRDELARDCGLPVGERGGIQVDNTMRTADPAIFAIGEVALHRNFIYGLVAPGYKMAATAVSNILGGEAEFTGFDLSTSLKLIGVDVASFGDAFAQTSGSLPVVYSNSHAGTYKKLVISGDGTKLLGGILVGDASDYGKFRQIMENSIVLPPEKDALLVRASGSSADFELPESAEICKCNNVNKKAILAALDQGATDAAGVKELTRAGAGCGGCMPIVNDVVRSSLKKMGKTLNTNLCEHFSYSRQDLFQIIRVKNLKTFRDVISSAGKGAGCDVCKPAVASMLASVWNELVVKQDVVQDTNDRYLANIQKGGTYSVIPRIPGGEITPERLIALGETAKKYDLYCKITGGQRIDLLGARVDQLPDIWEDLIDAGFESGHAYGKAMRTVKSCVGSTWCRYGVQDSTSFAIRIEERYRGVRAPHKLKSAVSGCIRECAEAQSKDFGLIATEKGWNIYVCGNGGARPEHAKLLASDVDEDTAIVYLDRFIMYYIRTADRLTRTSVWLQNLEGGIEHLKSVLVQDSLGICADLEQEMRALIDTYACEWKEVVKNPELRARFRHFANSAEPDGSIRFIPERGQKRPAFPGVR